MTGLGGDTDACCTNPRCHSANNIPLSSTAHITLDATTVASLNTGTGRKHCVVYTMINMCVKGHNIDDVFKDWDERGQ